MLRNGIDIFCVNALAYAGERLPKTQLFLSRGQKDRQSHTHYIHTHKNDLQNLDQALASNHLHFSMSHRSPSYTNTRHEYNSGYS